MQNLFVIVGILNWGTLTKSKVQEQVDKILTNSLRKYKCYFNEFMYEEYKSF